jgi:S1-C subfamily serine protease
MLNTVAALKPNTQAPITVQRGSEKQQLQVTVTQRPSRPVVRR